MNKPSTLDDAYEMRDPDKNPYTPEEQRVAAYINEITGIGGGNDPIGFLIAFHASLLEERKQKQ